MIDIQIYTDGSSQHNGKPNCIAGWAMVIPNFRGKMFIRYGNLPAPSSNNKGEIVGVLYALSIFANQTTFHPEIFSDSQYVVNSVTNWANNWEKINYEGIKNRALIMPMHQLYKNNKCKVALKWVKGHAGLHGNELADEFCSYGRQSKIMDKQDDVSDIKFISHDKLPYDLISP